MYVPCLIRHGSGSSSSGSRRVDFCMFSRCAARGPGRAEEVDEGKTLGMRVTAGIRGTGSFGTGLDFQKKEKKEKDTLKRAKPVGLPTETLPFGQL